MGRLGLGIVDYRLTGGGSGRGKCLASCKKGEGIIREGEMSDGIYVSGICPDRIT